MVEELKSMIGDNEKIYWEGKPDKKCYIFEAIVNPMLPFAIVWALFDSMFIGASFLSNESRKIVCAQKHFQSVGLEYKVVDDKDLTWWKPNTKNYAEEVFGEKTDTDENTLTIV